MDLITIIVGFFILIYSVILHEIAHGFVAERLGDPTARRSGRLTLNPLPHIDPIMTIIVPLVLFITTQGRFVFGGAKPVPINPLYFDDLKKDTALVAAAGALTNFGLAGIGAILFWLVVPTGQTLIIGPLQYMVFLNLLLGLFNLIPIPPLDGSKVLAAILPTDMARVLLSLEPFGLFIILILLYMTGLLTILSRIIDVILLFLHVPSPL